MRMESARLWREFLSGYERIHVYTADPGAHAIAVELVLTDRACRAADVAAWLPAGPPPMITNRTAMDAEVTGRSAARPGP